MKKVFISHPLTGDIEGNRKKVDRICRYIVGQGLLPISPLHLFSYIDEEDERLRNEIMEVCYRLIDLSDEVWIYGNSEGCKMEKEYAELKGKEVIMLLGEKKS